MLFNIIQTKTSADMGIYEAETKEEALIEMHIDAGAAPDTASDDGLVAYEMDLLGDNGEEGDRHVAVYLVAGTRVALTNGDPVWEDSVTYDEFADAISDVLL